MTSLLLSGGLTSALKLAGLLLLAYVLVLWLSAVVWVYRDVRNRTDDQASQLIAVLLVALFNLPGLIVYLVIRPQSTMVDSYERSLEAEAVLHELQLAENACPRCQRPIEDEFNICPNCRTTLREGCRNCGRAIRTTWVACPYCATERVAPRPAAASNLGESLRPPRRTEQDVEGEEPPRRRRPVAREG
jgi:RNA polymerase subunit RPABC4/transcription elongation factor Spt4